jgi:hypothetical protein
MRRTVNLIIVSASIILALSVFGEQPRLRLPEGYIVVRSSISPDGRYGVSAYDGAVDSNSAEGGENQLVDIRSGRTCGPIGGGATIRMNRGGIQPARWSADMSSLLWEVEGRWSPLALTLIKLKDSKITSQFDVLGVAQKAILERTRQAAPAKYAAAKKFNKGSGSAFPDGFAVNVRAEGDKPRGEPKEDIHGIPIALPFKVHVELTSNPKALARIGQAQLDSELDGVVAGKLTFAVTRFRLREKPFQYATSSSYLEMTNPSAAANAPMDYGDKVNLRGRVASRTLSDGRVAAVLTLKHPITIGASANGPAEPSVAEVQLTGRDLEGEGVDLYGRPQDYEFDGTLSRSRSSDSLIPVTLIVSGYGTLY